MGRRLAKFHLFFFLKELIFLISIPVDYNLDGTISSELGEFASLEVLVLSKSC